MYGTVDVDALRERGVTAAAVVVEAATQGEEEAGGSELASNTCTWPPSEAEYFFGEYVRFCSRSGLRGRYDIYAVKISIAIQAKKIKVMIGTVYLNPVRFRGRT